MHSHYTRSCTSTLFMFSTLTLQSVMSQSRTNTLYMFSVLSVISQYIVYVQYAHTTLSCPSTLYMFSTLTLQSVMYWYIVHVQYAVCHVPVHCTCSVCCLSCPSTLFMFSALTLLCHIPVHCTCSMHSHCTLVMSQYIVHVPDSLQDQK